MSPYRIGPPRRLSLQGPQERPRTRHSPHHLQFHRECQNYVKNYGFAILLKWILTEVDCNEGRSVDELDEHFFADLFDGVVQLPVVVAYQPLEQSYLILQVT